MTDYLDEMERKMPTAKVNPCGCKVAITPTTNRARSREETDAIIDNIVVDEDFNRAIPGKQLEEDSEWDDVKVVLTVLVGNQLDFLSGVFVGSVKKRDLSTFYVDDSVKVNMVESGHSLGTVGKKALTSALKSLQRSFANHGQKHAPNDASPVGGKGG
jgi:hypothetical protein